MKRKVIFFSLLLVSGAALFFLNQLDDGTSGLSGQDHLVDVLGETAPPDSPVVEKQADVSVSRVIGGVSTAGDLIGGETLENELGEKAIEKNDDFIKGASGNRRVD